jgi:hypothetical protein
LNPHGLTVAELANWCIVYRILNAILKLLNQLQLGSAPHDLVQRETLMISFNAALP